MYKTVLCKYGLTASKTRVMGIRAMGNRVRRGMTVIFFFFTLCATKIPIFLLGLLLRKDPFTSFHYLVGVGNSNYFSDSQFLQDRIFYSSCIDTHN